MTKFIKIFVLAMIVFMITACEDEYFPMPMGDGLVVVIPITESSEFTRDDSKEVVYQKSSGLMWQDDVAAETVQKRWLTVANYDAGNYYNTSGDTAMTYCTALDHGGFSDWRLPTKEELFGIVKSDTTNPSISVVFQHTASLYWSSTTYSDYINSAWYVNFNYGGQNGYNKSVSHYVRCVRAGQ